MNQEIKQKWVAALRSGEYKQGQGSLRLTNNTFCCMGVLCDIHMKETHNGKWNKNAYNIVDDNNHYSGCPPPDVWKWLGMEPSNKTWWYKCIKLNATAVLTDKLSDMNDGLRPDSFDRIANYIEGYDTL